VTNKKDFEAFHNSGVPVISVADFLSCFASVIHLVITTQPDFSNTAGNTAMHHGDAIVSQTW